MQNREWKCVNGEKITKFLIEREFSLPFQVMDAEKQKADSGADHAEKTQIFHAAESKVSLIVEASGVESRFRGLRG